MNTQPPHKRITQAEFFSLLQESCMMDDFFFSLVLIRYPSVAREIIAPFLQGRDLSSMDVDVQSVHPSSDGKGVRFDAFIRLKDGTLIDVEVQRRIDAFPNERGVYYLSRLTSESLRKGEEAYELPERIVIVLTEHDPFHRGRALYSVSMYVDELFLPYDSRGRIYYLNLEHSSPNDPLGSLIHDLFAPKPADIRNKSIQEAVKEVKSKGEEAKTMFETFQRWFPEDFEAARKEGLEAGRKEGLETGRKEGLETGRKEGLESGRKEGLETGRMEVCADLVKQGLLSLEDAAAHAGVSPERLAEFIKGRETN